MNHNNQEINRQENILINDRAEELDFRSISTPIPLHRKVPDPNPFPFEALGDLLGPIAKTVHQIVQAPDAICGQSFLGAAALAAQRHADVHIDGRHIPLSLYLLTTGMSGDRKTAVDAIAISPIKEYQKMLVSCHEQELLSYRNLHDSWVKKRDALLSKSKNTPQMPQEMAKHLDELGPEPKAPLLPFLTAEEPTYEGLVKLLHIGQPSLGIFSNEGGRMIGGYGMNDKNVLKTACGLSSLWDGQEISRVRSGDGSFCLYGRRLSMHLMIQEIVLSTVLSSEILKGQGLLARCLVVFPKSLVGQRKYQETNVFEEASYNNYRRIISQILDYPLPKNTDGLKPRPISLSPHSKELWKRFHDDLERELGPKGKYAEIQRNASKSAEQVLRIAGVLTIIEDIEAREIKETQLDQAIALIRYYQDEFVRIHSLSLVEHELSLAAQVLDWLHEEKAKKNLELFHLSYIYQHGPSSVRTAQSARKMMRVLTDHDLVTFCANIPIDGVMRKEAWKLNVNEPHANPANRANLNIKD